MPYHVESDNDSCNGYAVVKDADGEVMGCHRTQDQAEQQIAAINASEDEQRAESYAPTQGMIEEARRGLDWREEYNRGGTEIGVARARDIVNGRKLSRDTIGRMASFFARHEVDKEGQGFTPDQDGYPSAGRIAWALWGGDPGKTFADAIMANEQRAAGDPPAIVTDIDGTLLIGRDINTDLVETLNNSDAAVLVVSAREPDQRPQTESRLGQIGLNYDELFLVGGANATTAKVQKVNELLERFDIIAAYENNETTRRAYADIGIDARNPISNRSVAEQILADIRNRR
jgi:hypothetical protein